MQLKRCSCSLDTRLPQSFRTPLMYELYLCLHQLVYVIASLNMSATVHLFYCFNPVNSSSGQLWSIIRPVFPRPRYGILRWLVLLKQQAEYFHPATTSTYLFLVFYWQPRPSALYFQVVHLSVPFSSTKYFSLFHTNVHRGSRMTWLYFGSPWSWTLWRFGYKSIVDAPTKHA